MCHFANLTTDHVANISYAAFESDWYEYPVDVQKYILLIMARSQNPVYFNGLGLLDCTLESFGKVWNIST